jgi:DNA mismatch endonuclease (patch repair protein)
MDNVDKATRSRVMARVHSKNAVPELIVRRGLFDRKFRYRLHGALPGKPDLVFRKYRAVIFVHGCFWHGHDCPQFRLPASNRDYWVQKIERNRVADQKSRAALKALGWRVYVVWECAIRGKGSNAEAALNSAAKWLRSVSVN